MIIAEGVIETDTPQAFVDFLRSASDDRRLKRIVFFNSRGGNVVASMVFGHILRELRVAGVIGRFESGADSGPFVGECLSACVYAMMGAVRRVAPEGSQVALHRMSIVESEGGGWGGPAHITRSFADKPMVAILKRYARRMGVNPALVAVAEVPAAELHAHFDPVGDAAVVFRDRPILGAGRPDAAGCRTLAVHLSFRGLRLTCRPCWLIRPAPCAGE